MTDKGVNNNGPTGDDKNTATGSNDTGNAATTTRHTRFVVTGFGPFQGVPTNPTSQIAEQLLEFLDQKNSTNKLVRISIETAILEVSVEAVTKFIDELKVQLDDQQQQQQQQHPNNNADNVVVLHLGVNYKGTGFQLETRAYNDATFRIPDERGYKPSKECVVPGMEWNTAVTTPLNVDALCQKLLAKHASSSVGAISAASEKSEKLAEDDQPYRIFASIDPGRFVCNYTYCYSLSKFGRDDGVKEAGEVTTTPNKVEGLTTTTTIKSWLPKVWSLFLHVPPAEANNIIVAPKKLTAPSTKKNTTDTPAAVTIPLHTQLQFVADLIELIQDEIVGLHQ